MDAPRGAASTAGAGWSRQADARPSAIGTAGWTPAAKGCKTPTSLKSNYSRRLMENIILDFRELFTAQGVAVLMQVIAIDLVLAGDNAIVIGLAAAGLPRSHRRKAILIGILAATVMRIGFATITAQLLQLGPMLLVAGGLLLLWVCWKMWRELSVPHEHTQAAQEALADADLDASGSVAQKAPRKTLGSAVWQIIIADVSMSLDNVLAVAGAAREHPTILIIGLALSIALMGLAATFIARLLERHRWIAYLGLAVILYVALDLIYRGGTEVWPSLVGAA